ncbi:PH domain-containing protein [Myxococcus landrumensis]|uniref:PH domain-containing protein n=1 Tax=Myxococcus landrumensis TaxID=2813577 RepID=A0ABX7MZ26_9BACT|nr:PH domain-containing protein [Myxococcus landrumus]QSQ11439.1 PH domain-containing protein [Myxococcus landrumus]
MAELPHAWLLRWLKVNPEPRLPEGTVRVFHAAPAYLTYRRVLLALKNTSVVMGTLIGWAFLNRLFPWFMDLPYARPVLYTVEAIVWLSFLVLLPVSFFVVRLDYSLRWYVLTDRSLRIREGVMSLREKTMTFANIQQISIQQNPIQRMLGIADVKVETAGGGKGSGSADPDAGTTEHLHEARFRGVSNAEAIRDMLLERVRMHRDTGLGEPTELITDTVPLLGQAPSLDAARELLSEVRKLRGALTRRER